MAYVGVQRVTAAASLCCLLAVLALSCCCRRSEGACLVAEKRALVELGHSINYPNATAQPSWGGRGANDDCCRWPGVTCDNSTGRVIKVEVAAQRAAEQGKWVANLTMLGHLTELRTLDLGNNQLAGWDFAPVLCKLKHLTKLDLSGNLLEGVPPPEFYGCISRMRSMSFLRLSFNQIDGSLPPSLCNLTSMGSLWIVRNRLSGGLPACIGNITSLQSVWLGGNRFGGRFPPSICNLVALQELDLSNNGLQGEIPPCMGNLYSLVFLWLEGNNFVGGIPGTIFSNMSNLTDALIASDRFAGTLELSAFANLSKLESLSISSNQGLEIETESSSWAPAFQLQTLSIRGCPINRRSGYAVPTFLAGQLQSLSLLKLNDCSLAGTLPPALLYNSSLSILQLWNNRLADLFPQPEGNLSSSLTLKTIEIFGNRARGSLPGNLGDLFPLLTEMTVSQSKRAGGVPASLGRTALQFLDLSGNRLSGGLPAGLSQNATSLEWVDLSDNGLEGEILRRESHVPILKYLYLSGNRFAGGISPSISNSSLLKILDLRRNRLKCDISTCLGVLEGAGNISGLLLGGNLLEGQLPGHLCRKRYLQVLDLSDNNISGKILPCFGNVSLWRSSGGGHRGFNERYWGGGTASPDVTLQFTSKYAQRTYTGDPLLGMTGLDLSGNRLEGTVPPELGALSSLLALNLSHNHLRGPIPAALGNMRNAESLDLSHNDLTGGVPRELAALSFLSSFSVAFNGLSGEIPFGGQLSTFNRTSFEGNPALCGTPLGRICPSEDAEHKGGTAAAGDGDDETHGILDNDRLFYLFLALSYVAGLWCVFLTLLFHKKWRSKFFMVIDRFYFFRLRRILRRNGC